MSHYSAWQVFYRGLFGKKWSPALTYPELQSRYDVIIIGGGGHGLATAYYLAKNHGYRKIAVIEKNAIGLGNVGRNTTIIRSNYMLPENNRFYEKSLQLWESLSQEINYNVMFSQRGVLNLAHSDAQMDAFARRGNAMRLQDIDAKLLNPEQVKAYLPQLAMDDVRFPIYGGLVQTRGGTARHDAVAWGFARAALTMGVDIIQHCEVKDFVMQGDRVVGIETTKGRVLADKIGMAVAGSTSLLANKLKLKLPIESMPLQAFVTEAIKPVLNRVVTFGAGHFYISQSDKGSLVFGGNLDTYNSYAQRGNLPVVDEVITECLALFPQFAKLRLLRSWAGIMDMSMDGTPIISASPYEGLYLNCGWCYGGFKAVPGSGFVFAHTIANGKPHQLNAAMGLERFSTGNIVDEKGAGPYPKAH